MAIQIHKEPIIWANAPAENCIFCKVPTRTWSDDYQPVCEGCAKTHDSMPTDKMVEEM